MWMDWKKQGANSLFCLKHIESVRRTPPWNSLSSLELLSQLNELLVWEFATGNRAIPSARDQTLSSLRATLNYDLSSYKIIAANNILCNISFVCDFTNMPKSHNYCSYFQSLFNTFKSSKMFVVC